MLSRNGFTLIELLVVITIIELPGQRCGIRQGDRVDRQRGADGPASRTGRPHTHRVLPPGGLQRRRHLLPLAVERDVHAPTALLVESPGWPGRKPSLR